MEIINGPVPYDTGWPSGTYLAPANLSSAPGSSAVSTSALITFLPFVIPRSVTVTKIGLWLVTQQTGAECRLGIYTSDNGKPGTLIVDGGTLDLSTGTGSLKEVTISQALGPGMVWVACHMKNVATAVTVTRMGFASGQYVLGSAAYLGSQATGNRYYQQSTAYGSPLLATAGAVTAASGSDAPVTVLGSA